MNIELLTLFPEQFPGPLSAGVTGRGLAAGRVTLRVHNLRDYTHDRHRQVDDVPYGGGAGMVLKPEPIFEAVDQVRRHNPGPVILMEPWGEPLSQALAAELAAEPGLVIVCGRYEGVDDRVRLGLEAREISIGEYVLSGAELPAMILIDAVARLIPGVLGDPGSLDQDSFTADFGGYPQFTRPAEFRGMKVPEVLLSGDHRRIREWRRLAARRRAGQMERKT